METGHKRFKEALYFHETKKILFCLFSLSHRDKCGSAFVAGYFQTLNILRPQNIKVIGRMAMVRNSVGVGKLHVYLEQFFKSIIYPSQSLFWFAFNIPNDMKSLMK